MTIGRKVRFGYYIALFALFIEAIISIHNADELKATSGLVTHTVEALRQLESLDAQLLQTESAARGYGLTGKSSFQETIKSAPVFIEQKLRSLRTLLADNPGQQRRLDALEPIVAQRLTPLKKVSELQPASDEDRRSQVLALVEEDKSQMAEARRLLAEMSGEERKLLRERQFQAQKVVELGSGTAAMGMMVACVLVLLASGFISRSITKPLNLLRDGALRIGAGDYSYRVAVKTDDEVGQVAPVFNQMAAQIQERQQAMADQTWLKTSLARFSTLIQGQRDLNLVSRTILEELARQIEIRHSVFYLPAVLEGEIFLRLEAAYACENPKAVLKAGEGLAGQCLLTKEHILLEEVPAEYPKITSALGGSSPAAIMIWPLVFEGEVKAVLELARLQRFTPLQLALLEQLAPMFANLLHTIEANLRTEQLLKETKAFAGSLHLHQTELSRKNRELEEQSAKLRKSEQLLQEQHEEVRQANEELEQTNEELQQAGEEMQEKATLLAEQKKAVEETNREMELARAELEEKAGQLAQTSKYKSEFLANMSHELRTPLNSLLILSKILTENAGGTLTAKQVQYADTIHSSANDLLDLINDVLDLSKVESGTVEVDLQPLRLRELVDFAEASFRHVAESKRLDFQIQLAGEAPPLITTDPRRLQQIIANLLSNAFKFTSQGSVTMKISPVRSGWKSGCPSLDQATSVLAFAVMDTGIGIPAEKQGIIFEAFHQAEAGTARKYGGTGLGLSISRDLARLLGGCLTLESVPEQGSSFTLFLPETPDAKTLRALKEVRAPVEFERRPPTGEVKLRTVASNSASADDPLLADDRANIELGDLVLLIIEDDPNFARVLAEFAREKKFKVVVAGTAAGGIALARQLKPSAITLDLILPDGDGWVVLDRLKHDSQTRHIPVHVISAREKQDRGLRQGAVSCLEKPVTKEALEAALSETIKFLQRPVKSLLVVEDDPAQRQSIIELIGNGDVKTTPAATAGEALDALDQGVFDCIVLDLGLPDMSGAALIREIHKRHADASPPIVIYTAKTLTRDEETELRMLSESIVIKDARSPERLLDETALFLHRGQSKLPEFKRRLLDQVQKKDSVLAGRKVLVVDDDIRNIFAITSALESHQMKVLYAESGSGALVVLENNPDIQAVLMDVMMPEMDGFEATRRIRRIERFKKLPVICVTAKAMKGDREKCIQAGASDYITKPVDMDQLRSLLRVWLYR